MAQAPKKGAENDDHIEDLIKETENLARAKGRGKETLFRVTIRNQVDHIAIADNKANMIIAVNTFIITLIVAGLGTGMSFTELNFLRFPQIIAPLTILMLGCIISAIFSILAAKPRFLKDKGNPDPETTSLLFFGSYRNLSLRSYIKEMNRVLSSNRSIYQSLVIDMYFNGQVLSRKYQLLAYSYLAFLIGLIGCVIVYMLLTQFA